MKNLEERMGRGANERLEVGVTGRKLRLLVGVREDGVPETCMREKNRLRINGMYTIKSVVKEYLRKEPKRLILFKGTTYISTKVHGNLVTVTILKFEGTYQERNNSRRRIFHSLGVFSTGTDETSDDVVVVDGVTVHMPLSVFYKLICHIVFISRYDTPTGSDFVYLLKMRLFLI